MQLDTSDRLDWLRDLCPIVKALETIGPPSSVLMLREANFGTTRFDDFARRLGMTDSAVTARLRQLVDAGLLAKVPYQEPGRRTRYEYRLTDEGRKLLPALVSLMQWGAERIQAEGGQAPSLTHQGCGEPVRAEVRCAAGHRVPDHELRLSRRR
jgi:DNA-binding HxlR family transcriptional regulator